MSSPTVAARPSNTAAVPQAIGSASKAAKGKYSDAHRFSLTSSVRNESADIGESADVRPDMPINMLETKMQKMTDPEKLVEP